MTDEEKTRYAALLKWADVNGWEGVSVISYRLANGEYVFSRIDVIETLINIVAESQLSDRLLVILCNAYLEDQIRVLLEKFLVDDEVAQDMFERSSASFMSNLAYTLGLITKDWYDTLKALGKLRNSFAHRSALRSFDDLLRQEPKFESSISRLKLWSTVEDGSSINHIIQMSFTRLFSLLQFSIDHVAASQKRTRLEPNAVVDYVPFMGFTRDIVRSMLDGEWTSLSDTE